MKINIFSQCTEEHFWTRAIIFQVKVSDQNVELNLTPQKPNVHSELSATVS